MNKDEELIKKVDIQRIANEGSKIYIKIRAHYEPVHIGEFLAIEIDSGNAYLGKTSAKALELARENHPDKVFYVAKIGYDAAETMANSFSRSK